MDTVLSIKSNRRLNQHNINSGNAKTKSNEALLLKRKETYEHLKKSSEVFGFTEKYHNNSCRQASTAYIIQKWPSKASCCCRFFNGLLTRMPMKKIIHNFCLNSELSSLGPHTGGRHSTSLPNTSMYWTPALFKKSDVFKKKDSDLLLSSNKQGFPLLPKFQINHFLLILTSWSRERQP